MGSETAPESTSLRMPVRQLPITDFAHKAAVIGDAAVAALLASFDVSAECRRAAGLDGRHHLELGEADMSGVGCPPGRPSRTEDVGDLQGRSHRRVRRPGSLLPSAA